MDWADKVQKLLAKAAAEGTTTAEAEECERLACEIMVKHSIDRAMLEHAGGISDVMGNTMIYILGPYPGDQSTLVQVIARNLNCSGIELGRDFSQDTAHPHDKRTQIFGYSRDREMVQLMYLTLWMEVTSRLAHSVKPEWMHARKWNNSFIKGFIWSINKRLEEQKRSNTAEAKVINPKAEIVLLTRAQQSRTALNREHPDITHRTRSASSAAGFSSGAQAGREASLTNQGSMGRTYGAIGG